MFDATMDKYTFKFGINTDNDPGIGIYKGRISLSNQELKPVFDAVIEKIITSCSSALIRQRTEVSNVSLSIIHSERRLVCPSRWWIRGVPICAKSSFEVLGRS
jgi:hypothetical protein